MDAIGPVTISFCILEVILDACRADQSGGDYIWWHCLSFMEVAISGNLSNFFTVLWKYHQVYCFFMCPDLN